MGDSRVDQALSALRNTNDSLFASKQYTDPGECHWLQQIDVLGM